ncbi:MAG TPA: pyridoxamine 5'-phosphate oxidase family protein [Streptosporangiaceae bacterium]|nr:pyridoxamine 5'-phosphate oxidase family protein [Streptosporangiaceae bacterium]
MSELGDLQDQSFATATAATNSSYPPERRLTAEQLASYLDRRSYAVIGSARADGRPHAAMSVYVRRGTTFWLPTMAGSVRERNVRRTPWLTLVIAEQDDSRHIAVIAEGPTDVIEPSDVPQDVREAVTSDWASSWIRVTAKRLLSYADKDAAL